ncbi:MAG: phosphoglucosamine mutase [Deltaproteobacteria bacterium]|nr:phosphoglucosamine mutase [Deltaproteobacteria bacterium]
MERKLFGTDGVRGVANEEPMTPETAMRLGMAIAARFRGQGGALGSRHGRIVIGKDTRLSGYLFETALSSGIVSMGADVLLCGPLPTPGIAFITSSMRADAGVVISASHNPYQDNGIKIFARDGFKLPDQVEMEIEALAFGDTLARMRPGPADIGKATRIQDAVGRYVVFLKNTFPKERTLDGIKVVVDCASGAAYKVAPAVLAELGAQVISLGVTPDGKNINDRCGALHPEKMCEAVRNSGAHMGMALDGDGDRVIICDERGMVVDGDAVMALCGSRMLAKGTLRQNTVVATVMSNIGLERALAARGGKLLRAQVGDRYVVEEMRRGGYNFGGEQSGHLIFLDHMTTGDGVVAALAVLAAMLEESRPVSELASCMVRAPQVLVSVKVAEKRPIESLPGVLGLISKVEAELGAEGRILVRYSGTESKARVMIEGPDEGRIRAWAEEVGSALVRATSGV